MPQHTKSEREKKRGEAVTSFFSGKPIPGGVSATAFERVINQLKDALLKRERKKKQTQAEKMFGKE